MASRRGTSTRLSFVVLWGASPADHGVPVECRCAGVTGDRSNVLLAPRRTTLSTPRPRPWPPWARGHSRRTGRRDGTARFQQLRAPHWRTTDRHEIGAMGGCSQRQGGGHLSVMESATRRARPQCPRPGKGDCGVLAATHPVSGAPGLGTHAPAQSMATARANPPMCSASASICAAKASRTLAALMPMLPRFSVTSPTPARVRGVRRQHGPRRWPPRGSSSGTRPFRASRSRPAPNGSGPHRRSP